MGSRWACGAAGGRPSSSPCRPLLCPRPAPVSPCAEAMAGLRCTGVHWLTLYFRARSSLHPDNSPDEAERPAPTLSAGRRCPQGSLRGQDGQGGGTSPAVRASPCLLGFLAAGLRSLAHGGESCQKSLRSAVPALSSSARRWSQSPGKTFFWQGLLKAGDSQPPLSPTFWRPPGTQPGRRRGWKRASASALWRSNPWTISSKLSSKP